MEKMFWRFYQLVSAKVPYFNSSFVSRLGLHVIYLQIIYKFLDCQVLGYANFDFTVLAHNNDFDLQFFCTGQIVNIQLRSELVFIMYCLGLNVLGIIAGYQRRKGISSTTKQFFLQTSRVGPSHSEICFFHREYVHQTVFSCAVSVSLEFSVIFLLSKYTDCPDCGFFLRRDCKRDLKTFEIPVFFKTSANTTPRQSFLLEGLKRFSLDKYPSF